jgi:uncharacterized membrane protein
MKKIVTIIFCLTVGLFAQYNPELNDIGEGGVSGISKNGTYVCGSNYPNLPFVWTETNGRTEIGDVGAEVFSVSNNGIVVGRFLDSNLTTTGGEPVLRAGYWENNQWIGFEGIPGEPPLDAQSFTHAYGVNSEGNKVVGMVWHQNWRVEACYWSIPDIGIGLLGQTGNYSSRANAVSNDGSIVAGWDGIQNGPDRRAYYWDPAPHFIGGFDPTYLVGECRGMNSDGSVIVGGSVWPFIWTESTGMQHVVADSSDYWNGDAIGISDNGIIVGFVDPGGFNYQAFIKKPGWSDIIYLKDFIEDSLGITTYSTWYFAFGNAISADGNVIGITAYPPGLGAHALVLTLDTTVPVELSNFTANIINESVQLSWTTVTEKNNSGFEVQRKKENQDWEVLGFVAGRGTSTELSNYNYTDELNASGNYLYRLKQMDFDGTFEFSNTIEVDVTPVREFALNQNYPNPFNPSTIISFSVAKKTNVILNVYNLLGEKVATLINEIKDAGSYSTEFNASNLTSGIYIYKLEAGSFVSTKKMMLIK